MTRLRPGILVVAALVAVVANAGEGKAPPADPLAQRLCDALHAVPAKRRSECCGGAPAPSLAAACGAELSASVRRGAASLDAAGIERCERETARQLEGCGWVTPLLPRLPAACQELVSGKLKAGASCRSSLECLDGLYCKGAGPTTPGVCGAPAAPRTRCEAPGDNLSAFARAREDARHAECQGRCVKGQCLPFVAAGGTCSSSVICTPGLHCVGGRCAERPLPKADEACSAATGCEAGAVCSAGRCVAPKGAGEPCAFPAECRSLACAKAPGATSGACTDPCAAVSTKAVAR